MAAYIEKITHGYNRNTYSVEFSTFNKKEFDEVVALCHKFAFPPKCCDCMFYKPKTQLQTGECVNIHSELCGHLVWGTNGACTNFIKAEEEENAKQ